MPAPGFFEVLLGCGRATYLRRVDTDYVLQMGLNAIPNLAPDPGENDHNLDDQQQMRNHQIRGVISGGAGPLCCDDCRGKG